MPKKSKPFMLNRKDYNRIRRMDHCQLSLWVESVYKSGFEDGTNAVNEATLTVEQVKDTIVSIKGVGEKRVAVVCKALEKNLARKGIDGEDDEC